MGSNAWDHDGPSLVRDKEGEAAACATLCFREPGFQKPGDWDGQSKQRVPISLSLVPDLSTIRLSLYFLSSLPGQAGPLEPFLKRNWAAVDQAIFSQLY